jgi:hypothetical protein
LYELEATTKGGSSDDIGSLIPIRIIRYPPISSFELMDPVVELGTWAGKIKYSVASKHRAIALGGLIPVEAEIVKAEAGVTVMEARFYLLEHHVARDQDNVVEFDAQKLVTEWPLTLDGKDQQMESWHQCLQLPLIVGKCSPDFHASGIVTTHTLHFAATLLIDGVKSEVCSA